MDANAAWVALDPALGTGLILAVLFVFAVSLAGPWYWLLQEETDDYDPYGGMDKTPMDDPMRSPDWCHAHGGSDCKDEEK